MGSVRVDTGRVTEVDGDEEEDGGAGEGVGGSIGGREATRCCTTPWNISTIFSIGCERKQSISGSVQGWFDHMF